MNVNNSTADPTETQSNNVNYLVLAACLYVVLVAVLCLVCQVLRLGCKRHRRKRRRGVACLMTRNPPIMAPRLSEIREPLLDTSASGKEHIPLQLVERQNQNEEERQLRRLNQYVLKLETSSQTKKTATGLPSGSYVTPNRSPSYNAGSPTSNCSYLAVQNASYEEENNPTTVEPTRNPNSNNQITVGHVASSRKDHVDGSVHPDVRRTSTPPVADSVIANPHTRESSTMIDDEYDDTVVVSSKTVDQDSTDIDDHDYDDIVQAGANTEDPFDEPPNDEQLIYDVFVQKNYCYIPRQAITINGLIGKGFFASVYEGVWKTPNGSITVAVKELKEHAEEEFRVKFLQEAAIMGQFNHPHIATLHGVILENKLLGRSCAIVIEHMSRGDLKKHLLDIQAKLIRGEITSIGNRLLLYSRQIAAGMRYLSKKKYVHRDLAARNVLLDANYTCKIGDFGLSRNLYDAIYYKSANGIVSWKWTAPEALEYGRFSSASDVWSFGCVLFEIWSLGKTPMATVDKTKELQELGIRLEFERNSLDERNNSSKVSYEPNKDTQIIEVLKKAYRMPPPFGCPTEIHRLITECWNPNHLKRPRFSQLCKMLARLEVMDSDEEGIYSGLSSTTSEYFDLQIYEEITNP